MVITRFSELIRAFHRLGPDDSFIGQVPASPVKSVLLADLAARGVTVIPSARAQLVNASKAAQALLLAPLMLAHTRVILRRKDLLDAVEDYRDIGIDTVVTKSDTLHCGHGIRKWPDLEMLYNCVSMADNPYPFVMQPFVSDGRDVRAIVVGGFCEAYERRNPRGFRANLSLGGDSLPCELTDAQHRFCREAMERVDMPYAHVDLLIRGDDELYLSEIRLNGGVRGARISRKHLDDLKKAHVKKLVERP